MKTEVAGNVGFALMRQFAVTYDLPNDALYFERYLNFGAPDIAAKFAIAYRRQYIRCHCPQLFLLAIEQPH